ncbi:nuclear transport factor 2 family protein [Kribbella sp. NPDC050124]|uniref:nuclear transport factor 2 family protein n=1 Tax=Kribbella sp. NPDC050124 TaxID=3364114 RepID=UPI003794A08F
MNALADRLEIADLFAELARVLDEGTPDELRNVYAKDIVVQSPRGGEIHGIDDVVAYVAASADAKTQHLHGNIVVTVDGDRAEASATQLAFFFHEGAAPHHRVGLNAKYTAVRTPAGWRFDRANIFLVWQEEV